MFPMTRFPPPPPTGQAMYGMMGGFQKKPMNKFTPKTSKGNMGYYPSNSSQNMTPNRDRNDYKGKIDDGSPTENPVVITHNLGGCLCSSDNESAFNLFSMIGKVIRIKYIVNRQKNLLVQLATPEQAQHVISVLNNKVLFGQKVSIMHGRHNYITETSSHFTQDKNVIKEYSFSPLNRCSATTASIDPTPVLMYLTENPVTLEGVSDFLTSVHAPKPKEVRVLNDKSGLIIYCDTEAALEAAALVNNGSVSEGNIIKLNFKKTIPPSSTSSSSASGEDNPITMIDENDNANFGDNDNSSNNSGNDNNNNNGEDENAMAANNNNSKNNNEEEIDDENDVFGNSTEHNNEDDDVDVV